jgi:hypothetical protein
MWSYTFYRPTPTRFQALAGGRPAGCLNPDDIGREGNANEFHTEHKGWLDRARR